MKVLTHFATERSLKLTVELSVEPECGVEDQKVEEIKSALRELGLDSENLKLEPIQQVQGSDSM